MFGKNEVAKPRAANDGFLVHSVFPTIQGEGPFAGKPAIFVRLTGCNLRCFWCDTDFEKGRPYRPGELAEYLIALSKAHNCSFVVITGGEPLLQPIHLLIDHPRLASFHFQIETAGSVWPFIGGLTERQNKSLSVVCSPKTPNIITDLRSTAKYDVYWKYILRATEEVNPSDGLPFFSTQREGVMSPLFRPNGYMKRQNRIFVQACDEGDPIKNKANLLFATAIAQKYDYRLSVQIHKLLGID